MAIYSLHHSAIGKATQERPNTAAAHIDYITRARALTRIDAARMPTEKEEAAAFLNEGEAKDRANGRVIDKVMLALPRELNNEQRAALIRGFAEEITQGRASWLAAFHEAGKDADNPHVHLVIRDRDPVSGKRVAQLSEKGSTERLRALWEEHANRALASAEQTARIDRRTLKAQGIDRRPTIHEGYRARRTRARGRPIQSRLRNVRNAALAKSRKRAVDYPRIDGGRGRADYNAAIQQEPEAQLWVAYDESLRNDEFAQLRSIHLPDVENSDFIERRRRRKRRKQRLT